MPETGIQTAAIYFPSWYDDPRRARDFGPGWSEWELVKAGRPRFEGHYQPIVPAWGHADESDPAVMQRSCNAASTAGIDAFLWDWYWYGEQDFLNRPLDETFLNLTDPGIKFALMWANHDWIDVFPARTGKPGDLFARGAVDPRQFADMADVIIERYFSHPNYWRPDGTTWFTVFQPTTLIAGLGGYDQTARSLEMFRKRTRDAGAGELHINAMGSFGDLSPEAVANLGFDSFGHYNWSGLMPKDQGLQVDYRPWREAAARQWRTDDARFQPWLDTIPNLTMGWDSTTRVHQDDEIIVGNWPFLPVVTGNTPEEFAIAARDIVAYINERQGSRIVTINAWNEWTEGSYLEPDDRYGMQYLDALRAILT